MKDHAKKELEKKLEKLKQELEQEKANDPFSDSERVNDNAADDTEAAEEEGHDRAMAISKELETSIERVEEALKRIENDTWGVCEKCGGEIEEERLKIDPAVARCSKCA